MKRILLAIALIGCATERVQKAPAPAPAPVAAPAPKPAPPAFPPDPIAKVEGDVTEAWVHGMEIIVKRMPTAELVAGQLAIRGGVRNWDAKTAGIEQLAFAVASSGGTEALDKYAFSQKLASLGSSIGAGAGPDYSSVSFKSLERNWEETFRLMGDVFLHPAMPGSEVELDRTRQLEAIKSEQETADGRLGLLAHKTIFAGHPYQNRAIGTPESVSRLTREELLAHLAKLRETSRLVLVVVGNVDANQVVELARIVFGALPRGDYREVPMPPLHFSEPTLTVQPEKLPTNYITGVFTSPGWRDPEFPAAMVAIDTLQWRFWEEVRTKRNLSYAPGAGLTLSTMVPRGSIYVTAVDPGTTIKVMFDEARRLASEPVPQKELEGIKATYLTEFLMGNESTAGIAGLLMRSQMYGGDWRMARAIPERVKQVTPEQVQDYARRFLNHLQMVALGDPAKIDRAVFTSL